MKEHASTGTYYFKKGSYIKKYFQDAIDRVIGGLEKKSKINSPEEKKMIMALSNDNNLGTNSFNQVVERLVRKYPDSSFLRFETIFATINDIGPDMILSLIHI